MYYFIDIWSKTYNIPNITFWFCNTAFLFRRVLMDEEKQRRPPDSCPIIFDSWYGEFHLKTYPMQCSQICFAPNFKWAVTLSGSSFYILPRATLRVSTKMHFHPIIMNVPLDLLVAYHLPTDWMRDPVQSLLPNFPLSFWNLTNTQSARVFFQMVAIQSGN